jgi:hypothetical protein
MGLGDFIRELREQKDAGPLYLGPHIIENLFEENRKYLGPDMWFSPSQLSKMCPRAYAIAWKLGLPLVDRFDANARWRMDFGTAMHTLMQDIWGGDQGWLLGGWKCSECGSVEGYDPEDRAEVMSHNEPHVDKVTVNSAVLMPKACPSCGMKPGWRRGFAYVEPLLYDLESGVAGWTDGILRLAASPLELFDIKTTAAIRYVLEHPDPDHIKQLNWYLGMAGLTQGRIIYIDRTAKFIHDAIVEHPIEFDQVLHMREKGKVRELRETLKAPKEDPTIPSCPDGGAGRWGPCACAELESTWQAHGA